MHIAKPRKDQACVVTGEKIPAGSRAFCLEVPWKASEGARRYYSRGAAIKLLEGMLREVQDLEAQEETEAQQVKDSGRY